MKLLKCVVLILYLSNNIVILSSDIKIGFWSSWNKKCGIAIYLNHICKALNYKNYDTFVYNYTLSDEELIKQAVDDQINILNIQYEPTLFKNFDNLFSAIIKLKKRDIKVILTIHWETEILKQLIPYVEMFVYHKPPIFLKDVNKIMILPMGVPVFEIQEEKQNVKSKYNFNKEDIILSATGFMSPWKEYADILGRLTPFLKSNLNYKIQLLTSFNDISYQECLEEYKKIKNVIKKNKIENQVIHITNFLTQEELSERLWISDVGYLWGSLYSNATSASAKEFISARLPLITTKSSHFHDLDKGIIKTEIDKDIFCNTIINILNNKEKLNDLRLEQENQYSILNYNSLINRYIELFKKVKET